MIISTDYGNVKIIKASQTMPYKLYRKTFKSKSNKTLSKELENIIKKYYPDYTKKEILELYKQLNSHGCTYASIANVIVEQLGNDDDIFQEFFGYSIYDNNGNINYNKLSVDIFACISKMVELKVHIYDNYEFSSYIEAAKKLLNLEFKTEDDALLALIGNPDSKWITVGMSEQNKYKLRSKNCINKSYFGTYEQIAKELFGVEIKNLTKNALNAMLVKNNFTFDYHYEYIPSKLSGLANKKSNIKKWLDKFFAINGMNLDLQINTITASDFEYQEFIDNILEKINAGYSIEVSAPLKKELWMTDGKGWERPNSDKAGHQMNFEGFDKDGNILVCSFGKTYMFPKEFYKSLEYSAIKINSSKLVENIGRKSR